MPNMYAYVEDSNIKIDPWGLARFLVTPNGTVVDTTKNIDLVSNSNNGDWFQIHFDHEHDGLSPHTHYPEKNIAPNGRESTVRRYKATTAEDIDFADKKIKDGEMRQRNGRKDKGGPLSTNGGCL